MSVFAKIIISVSQRCFEAHRPTARRCHGWRWPHKEVYRCVIMLRAWQYENMKIYKTLTRFQQVYLVKPIRLFKSPDKLHICRVQTKFYTTFCQSTKQICLFRFQANVRSLSGIGLHWKYKHVSRRKKKQITYSIYAAISQA